MRILVTGGTGVIGAGAIPELLRAGHRVRLLSRGAKRDAQEYPEGVEPYAADITNREDLTRAAAGCEAVIHIAGIVEEIPPDVTYERINVEGTRNILEAARSSGVRRFIFLSSLGADVGEAAYHKSKLRAEELVREFGGEWLILRPGNVYGPGDEVISVLFKMVRSLPVIPLVGQGDHDFQPIWFEDLGKVIAKAVDDSVLSGKVLELTGDETTTAGQLIDRICEITARTPTRIPLPAWVAQVGTSLAEMFGGNKVGSQAGLSLPLNSAKLTMLLEGNVIRNPDGNALTRVFGLEPTPLDTGLRTLADAIPELLPEHGIGSLERKRFWADISGSKLGPAELMAIFRENVTEIMPIEFAAEPAVPTAAHNGATLTGAIPGRGHIQVRVEEETPTSVTFATIEGHPLAGVVSFRAEPVGETVRFSIEIHARAANIFDWIALRTVGSAMQNQNWKQVVQRLIELSGGHAANGVEKSSEKLSDDESKRVETWVRRMVRERKRGERSQLAAA